MTARTIFLGRLIGLFCIVCVPAVLLHRHAVAYGLVAILNNRPLLWTLGLLSVIAGLAMVLLHNLWRGGLFPVVVTLAGWGLLLKGAIALYLPAHATVHLCLILLHCGVCFYLYGAAGLLFGIYLAWEGFRKRPA